jgi:hypothetical protein
VNDTAKSIINAKILAKSKSNAKHDIEFETGVQRAVFLIKTEAKI